MEVEGWFLALLAIHGIKSWVWEGHLGTSMQQGGRGGTTQAVEVGGNPKEAEA